MFNTSIAKQPQGKNKMATPHLRLNKDAVSFAQDQINNGNYVHNKKTWEKEKPSPESEDAYLANHAWHNYGLWFLAINCEESQGTKAYYEFPLGNFEKIYYSALVAAKQHAEEYHHSELASAATMLIQLIEQKEE